MKTSLVSIASVFGIGSAHLLEGSIDFNMVGEGVVITEYDGADVFGENVPGTATFYGEQDRFSDPSNPDAEAGKTNYDKNSMTYGLRRDGILSGSIATELENNVMVAFDATCTLGVTEPGDPIDPPADIEQCTGRFETEPTEPLPDSDLFRPASRTVAILHNNDLGTSSDMIDYTLDPPRTTNPNDDRKGGCMFANFEDFCYGQGIDIMSIAFLDIDEDPTGLSIRCLTPGETPDYTSSSQFVDTDSGEFTDAFFGGDGSYNIVDTSAVCENTQKLEVCMPSSGAIDDIRFTCDTKDCEDDPKWYFKYRHKWRKCSYLKNKKDFCDTKTGKSGGVWGIPASEACKRTCGECGFKDFCKWDKECDTKDDDPHFRGKCYWTWTPKSCKDIRKTKSYDWKKYYCDNLRDSYTGKYAYEVCPGACSDECLYEDDEDDKDSDSDSDSDSD